MELFQQGMFVHDPRHDTPETIAQKRAIIAKIMSSQNAPRTIGDGLNALGDGIVANVLGRRADEAAAAGQESASEAFNPLMEAFQRRLSGNDAGFPDAPVNPGNTTSMATMPAPDTASARVAQAFGDSAAPVGNLSESKQAFIQGLLPAAIEEGKRTGVDPRIIVAQAAQETGWGRSAPGNNYFGIKSHGKGGGQTFTTHEVINGKRVKIKDSFRQFASPADSVRGYGDFILKNPRYRPFMAAQGLDAQLEALQASGYATDPNYSRSVGAIARGIPLDSPVAANEAMATGSLSNGLTPDALQQWAFANYAPQSQGDAVNGLATGTLPDPAQWPDIQRRAMASAPADPATWPQRQAELMRETSPQWLNDMIDGNGVPVAETEADILAQEQAMMGQDPQAFQQPGAGAPQAAAGQYAPLMPHQPAPPLPDPRMVQDMPVAPMQVAQAGGFPEMAGRNPQALPAPGIDMQMIANVLTNPFSNPEQRAFAQMLLEQQMQAQDPMRQLDMDYKRAQIEKMQREAASGGDEIFGTPIYGRDPNTGQMVLGAMGKDGSFKRLDTGGVDVTPGVTWQDFGTHRQAFDRSGNPVGGPVLRQGDVPGAHRQGPDGSLSPMSGSPLDNERRAELAKVEDNAYSIISMIDSLSRDPYLDGMLGPARSRLPNISADAARVQSKMDQIGGQAFLQAFQTLRGGGQISNVEGEKAQAAIARLNTAQSPKDYRQALNELKGIVQTSLERARGSAGSGAGGNPPSGASGEGWGDAGIPGVRIRRKQ